MKNKKMALLHSVIALLLCVSMLVGSTFAWFTDSVKTGINTIAAGVLDVELYHSNAAVQNEQVNSNTKLFMDLQGSPILWEPGVVSFENLRVANAGDLALTYQLALATDNENYIIDGNNQYGLSQILQVGIVEGGITATDRDGVVGAVTEWTTLASFLRSGSLLAAGEETWGVVVYWQPGEDDNRWNLNNGKTLNEGETLQIDLGVKLIATQEMEESDAIDKTYDENAKAEFFDGFQGGSAGVVVTADDQGITTAEVAMKGGDVSAVIPTGVQVASGVNSLALTVTKKAASEANIQLKENEEMRPLDVHIAGVAQGNTVPMLITLKHYLSTGINTGALTLYHVENGQTVAMAQVANPANHNEFSYDPATGDVTLALASFSEVAVVADTNNPWDGETINTLWYNASASELTISNADQLAGFAAIVDGKAAGIAQDSFAKKTVKLNNNIYLDKKNFDPIGWGYVNTDWNRDVDGDGNRDAGKVFQGTFDGNGKAIIDLYQNGWDLDPDKENYSNYTYTNCGFGLFAAASNATFKNLTINGADIKVECVETGILVGLSQGSCTYRDINIQNSKIANYQRPTGGLIGEVSCEGVTTITNVNIDDDVVVGSLWGDFDAPVGGVIGARWANGTDNQIYMNNVSVECRLDVYSDVTSSYQWYAYRRAGMLIGNTETYAPNENGTNIATANFLHCDGVTVEYGGWVDYHYCEFNNHEPRWPFVRVEAGENCSAFSNPRWGVPNDINGKKVVDMNHVHADGDDCYVHIPFGQLYGGGQGVYGRSEHENVSITNYKYKVEFINKGNVLYTYYAPTNNSIYTLPTDENGEAVKKALDSMKNEGQNIKFSHWMNAGSTEVESIPAGNITNYKVYPSFVDLYTATFVDQQGNVLGYEFFAKGSDGKAVKTKAASVTPPTVKDCVFESWQIHYTDDNGNVTGYALDKYDFASAKRDVTVYPIYTFEGGISLIPVDNNKDGIIDEYHVDGRAEANEDVNLYIPEKVNGKPITRVLEKSFYDFSALTDIDLPNTIEYLGADAFVDEEGGFLTYHYDQIQIFFDGTKAEWLALLEKSDENWDRYIGENSVVVCMREKPAGYFQLDIEKKWTQQKTGGTWKWVNGEYERPSNNVDKYPTN